MGTLGSKQNVRRDVRLGDWTRSFFRLSLSKNTNNILNTFLIFIAFFSVQHFSRNFPNQHDYVIKFELTKLKMAGNQDDVDSILVAPDELGKILILNFKDGKIHFTKKLKFLQVQAPLHQPLMQVVFDLGSIITVFMVNVMDDFGHTVSLFKYVYRSNSNLNKIWRKNFDISGKWILLSWNDKRRH